MSHVTAVNLQIKDLAALAEACKTLGLEYRPNVNAWRWFGHWVNDYNREDAAYKNGISPERYGVADAGTITIPGSSDCYEVGVYKAADGTYSLCWDFYGYEGRMMQERIGRSGGALKQAYATEVAVKSLKSKGFKVAKKLENGKVRLLATR